MPDGQEAIALRDQLRRVIEGLYLGLLDRVGEPEGVEAHAEALAAMGGIDALPAVIKGFLESEEYRARALQALRSTIQPEFREKERYRAQGREGSFTDFMTRLPDGPPRRTIHHVFGIGWACLTASLLRRWKLRLASGPFDWVFSNAAIVRHALDDDFATFLDRSQYAEHPPATPDGAPRTQHRQYGAMLDAKWAPLFNHHDLLRNEADYESLLRHVDHFRQAVQGPHNTLLVHIAPHAAGTRHGVEKLIAALDTRLPRVVVNAFLLEEPEDLLVPRLTPLGHYGRHRIFSFVPTSEVLETGFRGAVDEIGLIRAFSAYEFDLKPI